MNAVDIELACAHHFNFRQNIIVPNIHWGLGLNYEADIVVLRPSGYAMEIEIKVSRADIGADMKKRQNHNSNLFRQLWFAMPQQIADDSRIPERAGILAIIEYAGSIRRERFLVKTIRAPKTNTVAHKFTDVEIKHLLELGCMRIWSLKEKLLQQHLMVR